MFWERSIFIPDRIWRNWSLEFIPAGTEWLSTRRFYFTLVHPFSRSSQTHIHPSCTMSWQSYVDDQLLATKVVTKAVIAGHDGSIWATSEGFKVTTEDIKKILANFENRDLLAQNGITVAETRYVVQRIEPLMQTLMI